MTPLTVNPLQRLPSFGLLFVLLASSAACAADSALSDTLRSLRVERDVPVAYHETRMSEKLRKPAELEGTLVFTAAGELVKVVTSPYAETVIADDAGLQLVRKGKTRRLAADKNPGLQGFFQGLRAVLSGDVEAMDALFIMSLDTADNGLWAIECVSRDEDLQSYLQSMTLSGKGRQIQRIVTRQDDDRWQQIDILPALAEEF
jgi:hypothetical protein